MTVRSRLLHSPFHFLLLPLSFRAPHSIHSRVQWPRETIEMDPEQTRGSVVEDQVPRETSYDERAIKTISKGDSCPKEDEKTDEKNPFITCPELSSFAIDLFDA